MNKKAIVKGLAAAVMASCCIFSLCSCSFSPATESSVKASVARARIDVRINNQIKDMIGIDIDDEYIESAETISDFYSEAALGKIKITVNSGKETDLQKYLEGKLGYFQNISAGYIPVTQQHQYADELRQMTSIKYTQTVKTSTDGSSVTIYIYMGMMGAKTYLYICG